MKQLPLNDVMSLQNYINFKEGLNVLFLNKNAQLFDFVHVLVSTDEFFSFLCKKKLICKYHLKLSITTQYRKIFFV